MHLKRYNLPELELHHCIQVFMYRLLIALISLGEHYLGVKVKVMTSF